MTKKELERALAQKDEQCFALYCALYDCLEKENKENVASMIEFLTNQKFANECDWLKTFRISGGAK